MASLLRMSEPVCLIENSSTLRINEEAKAILSAISQRLVVVSIVGPYRSGKSYLMNKLSEQPGGVFSVSSTTEAKTKGIWMWCTPHPHKPDHTLVLLDTEGFGDTDKGDKDNDRKILALAMFMSSAVVYNSSNVINYDEVEKLGSTLELYCEVVDNAINKVPLFVWVVRDFMLKSDLDGRPATADEYLENCLKDIPPKTIKVKRTNMVRQKIREHFPKRKCFYFAFPSSDTKTVARMSQAPESQLEPEFVRNANDFCHFVLQETPEKELKEGRFMSGSDLAQVLQSYIDVVTKRTIHFLEHSISNIFLEENKRSICRSIESYESQMKAQLFKNGEEFDKQHEMSLDEALQEFRKSYVTHEKSQEEYLHQLEEALLKKRAELWRICEESSLKKCEEVYNKLTDEVDGALKKEKYHVPGGYDEFVKDKENIIQTYNKECDGGIKAPDVLKKLSNYLEDLGNTIPKIAAVKKPKKLKKGDSLDWNKLLEYVQDFQLPPGRFDHLLIQLFGYTGHGKSSFVNSCSYVLCNGRFKDQAGEGISQGGTTMERKAYNLTDTITIVDNRGFAKLQGQEAWEIYAQLCNFAPLNETVVWKKNLDERHKYILQQKKKSRDLIFPVFVCSGKHNLSEYECDNIKQFLRKAHELTGIQPFVVLTNSRRTSALQTTFSQMGIEKIFPVENYIVSDHIADREKHLHFLNFLKDVVQYVNFYLQENDNFQSQEHEWMSFLLKMAADLQMGSC